MKPKEEQKQNLIDMMRYDENLGLYEEFKQETLEEATDRIYGLADKYSKNRTGFIQGAKWQAKRMYSEEEVKQIIEATLIEYSDFVLADIPEWFEQFKKK